MLDGAILAGRVHGLEYQKNGPAILGIKPLLQLSKSLDRDRESFLGLGFLLIAQVARVARIDVLQSKFLAIADAVGRCKLPAPLDLLGKADFRECHLYLRCQALLLSHAVRLLWRRTLPQRRNTLSRRIRSGKLSGLRARFRGSLRVLLSRSGSILTVIFCGVLRSGACPWAWSSRAPATRKAGVIATSRSTNWRQSHPAPAASFGSACTSPTTSICAKCRGLSDSTISLSR